MVVSEIGTTYGVVLAVGTGIFGVVAILAAMLYVYASMFNFEPADGDTPKAKSRKLRYLGQRLMVLFALGSAIALAIAYLLALFVIGTFARKDGYTVNWTYFVGVSIAAFVFGLLYAVFNRIEGYARRVCLGVLFAVPFLFFALAPITPSADKRNVLFGLAIVFEFFVFVFAVWFSGKYSPFIRLYGLIPAGLIFVAFVLYDTFFYIGFLNEASKAVVLDSRWQSQVPFFIADVLLFILTPLACIVLYRNKRATLLSGGGVEAGVAVGAAGAGVYAAVKSDIQGNVNL